MRIIALIGVFILVFSTAVSAEMIIIVNENNPLIELSREDASKIFLGKKKRWDDGNKIAAVILKKGDTHERFLEKVVEKSFTQFDTYWKRIVFTGKGQALKSFNSEKQLIEFVANTPNAIGYIDSATPHAGVRSIGIH